MMTIRKAEDRGSASHGWLEARHTFSFADYHDPRHMGFRSLRVLNDDVIAPGQGFGMHPHRDMEIITYILSGALQHRDSMGNGRTIRQGEFQYMAAGTGVMHSEFNPSEDKPVHLLQIWLLPDTKGVAPRYAEHRVDLKARGEFRLIASKTGASGSFAIHQDAELLLARLNQGDAAKHPLKPGRHAWTHVAEGDVIVNGEKLKAGDGAALSGENAVAVTASTPAQVLLFDLN